MKQQIVRAIHSAHSITGRPAKRIRGWGKTGGQSNRKVKITGGKHGSTDSKPRHGLQKQVSSVPDDLSEMDGAIISANHLDKLSKHTTNNKALFWGRHFVLCVINSPNLLNDCMKQVIFLSQMYVQTCPMSYSPNELQHPNKIKLTLEPVLLTTSLPTTTSWSWGEDSTVGMMDSICSGEHLFLV